MLCCWYCIPKTIYKLLNIYQFNIYSFVFDSNVDWFVVLIFSIKIEANCIQLEMLTD